MPGGTKPIFVQIINNKGTTWVNADAALTKKTIFTAGANGSILPAISATSDDTVDRVFNLYLNDGTTDFLIGSKTVALGSGVAAVAAQNILASAVTFPYLGQDSAGRITGIQLPSGWILKAENVTQVTSAKTVTLVALGGNF